MTNIVVLVGRLARPPASRELPSGDRLAAFELTVERPGDRAESVPVVWFDPPARAMEHDAGDRVLVVGRVRRRFFRTGGATQSRTEVVAETLVPAHGRQAATALARAGSALEEAGSSR